MNIYQHFRPEERDFIDQVTGWKHYVEESYAAKLTDFLDPREQQIVKLIIGETTDIQCQFFGGADETERKRALISPDYYMIQKEDFQLCVFELQYPKKFMSIEHPQVLGSLLSLGLKREKFGDILIDGDTVQFVVGKEIQTYLEMNFTAVGKSKISLKVIDLVEAISIKNQWTEEIVTVTSLRLDVIVSVIYRLSRQKAQLFIENGSVKVNFRQIEKPSYECAELDLISVRGLGRTKISSIDGKTKKEKWRITVGKQK